MSFNILGIWAPPFAPCWWHCKNQRWKVSFTFEKIFYNIFVFSFWDCLSTPQTHRKKIRLSRKKKKWCVHRCATIIFSVPVFPLTGVGFSDISQRRKTTKLYLTLKSITVFLIIWNYYHLFSILLEEDWRYHKIKRSYENNVTFWCQPTYLE